MVLFREYRIHVEERLLELGLYTDACGNVATATQTITIDDTTPPTASNPADVNLTIGPAPAPDIAVVIDEADNCSPSPLVAFVSDVSDKTLVLRYHL